MGKDQDLLDAARTGNVVTIHKILSARPKNAFSQAIAIGLRRSVAPNCQDSSGYTPLHHAVLNGHRPAVEMLLKHDASPGLPDAKGSTPFHLAAWTGETEIIRVLMSHAKSYSQVNEQNNDWDTPMHFAAQYGHTAVVKILLENGADPTICNKKTESPLDLAAQYGRLEAVELLLDKRPELLDCITEQRSILHLAARNGHPLVIMALLDAGCNINKLRDGSALHEAALFGKVEAVRVLLEHKPPIDYRMKDISGETALQKVEGYPSKMAIEIASMIKAHIRGDPLPPSTTTPVAIRRVVQEPIDIEQQSTYDNVPPPTPPMGLRHYASTPPLAKKKNARQARATTSGKAAANSLGRVTGEALSTAVARKSVSTSAPTTSQVAAAAPSLTPTTAVARSSPGTNRNANYINMEPPIKVPPKKPARSSIGILLDKVDFSTSPKMESPLVRSSISAHELSSNASVGSKNQASEPKTPETGPPLPDRNYYDEDVAGEYTQLRINAKKTSSALPSVPLRSSVKCPNPPLRPNVPLRTNVPLKPSSSRKRNIYAPDDNSVNISSKEDIADVRRSLLLDTDPAPLKASTYSPVSAPVPAPGPAWGSAQVPAQDSDLIASSSPESESFYEDLSEAYSGEIVAAMHLPESLRHKKLMQSTMQSNSTLGSSTTGSDVDTDNYELLSNATSGCNADYDIPPPSAALSSVDAVLKELSPSRESNPVPPPRRSRKQSPTSRLPITSINNLNGGGSFLLPLPVSSPNSYYSDGRSSGTEESDTMPSSPGSYYRYACQPPTPDHPPPSPHTAKLGIQAKLSPQSFPHGNYPGSREAPNQAWTQREQESLDRNPSYETTGIGNAHNHAERFPHSQHYHSTEGNLYYSSGTNYCCPDPPSSNWNNSHDQSCEIVEPTINQSERPSRFGFQTTSFTTNLELRIPQTHQTSVSDVHQTNVDCRDGEPANNNRSFNVEQRHSDGYQSNDEFPSITDTSCSSSEDSDLLQLDKDDPFAGLIYGSNRGSHNLSLDTSSRLSLSQHMADWSLGGSSRTSTSVGENGLAEGGLDDGGGGAEETVGGIDENSEWAQIESIMASFGAGLVRESVYIRDFQKEFEKMFEGPTKPQSVGAWLENLGMGQYENMLIANGFDNLDFMGGDIMEEGDLIEMGVMEELHRKIILQSASALPVMKTINHEGNMPSSVAEWLRSLLLNDCIPTFINNGITTMDRAKELWELELESVLEVQMLGHRKRILASLGDRRRSFASSNSSIARPDSLELTTDDLELNLNSFERRKQLPSTASEQSASLDIDLFKDYSKEVTTPTKPKRLPNFTAAHESSTISTTEEQHVQLASAARQVSDVDDYDNTRVLSATGRGNDRLSSSLDEIDNGPSLPGVQWLHRPEALIKGCCNYNASYLGSTLVKEVKGIDSTQESCTKLRRSASHLQKIPSITLSISYQGVKFIDSKSKLIITDHEICNISCVTQDTDDLRTFAYITKDSENEKLYCHVFSVKAEETATEIILTLGQAFEIAYQILLKSRPISNEHHRHPSSASEHEDTKL